VLVDTGPTSGFLNVKSEAPEFFPRSQEPWTRMAGRSGTIVL